MPDQLIIQLPNGNRVAKDAGTVVGSVMGAGASYAQAIKTATQSIPLATPTAVIWGSETADTDTYHSNVTNQSRFTLVAIQAANTPYNLLGHIRASGMSGANVDVFVRKNGTTRLSGSIIPGADDNLTGDVQDVYLWGFFAFDPTPAQNDYYEVVFTKLTGVGNATIEIADSDFIIQRLASAGPTGATGPAGPSGSGSGGTAKVSSTSDVVIGAGGNIITMPWNNEVVDTDTFHSNVTNNTRLTISSVPAAAQSAIVTAFIHVDNGGGVTAGNYNEISVFLRKTRGVSTKIIGNSQNIAQGEGFLECTITAVDSDIQQNDYYEVLVQHLDDLPTGTPNGNSLSVRGPGTGGLSDSPSYFAIKIA